MIHSTAYKINHAVERHAFETYDKFLNEFGDDLANHPPPSFAVDYYGGRGGANGLFGDIFGYGLFSSSQGREGKTFVTIENMRGELKTVNL